MEKVTQSELAKEIGVSRQRIGMLVKRGILKLDKNKKLDREKALFILNENRKIAKVELKDYADARAEHENYKARIAELEYKRIASELILKDEVIAMISKVITTSKTKLMSIPGKIAPQIVGEDNIKKIKTVIEREINEVLNELANMKL